MATTVETTYARRARYYASADGFNIKRSRIPAHVFVRERERALDPTARPASFPSTSARRSAPTGRRRRR